jgi:hypothetical protein
MFGDATARHNLTAEEPESCIAFSEEDKRAKFAEA